MIETYTNEKFALQTTEHFNTGTDETFPPQTSNIHDSGKYFWGIGEPNEVTSTQQEASIHIESSSSNEEDLACSIVIQEEDLSLNNKRKIPDPEEGPTILRSGTHGNIKVQSLGYGSKQRFVS